MSWPTFAVRLSSVHVPPSESCHYNPSTISLLSFLSPGIGCFSVNSFFWTNEIYGMELLLLILLWTLSSSSMPTSGPSAPPRPWPVVTLPPLLELLHSRWRFKCWLGKEAREKEWLCTRLSQVMTWKWDAGPQNDPLPRLLLQLGITLQLKNTRIFVGRLKNPSPWDVSVCWYPEPMLGFTSFKWATPDPCLLYVGSAQGCPRSYSWVPLH